MDMKVKDFDSYKVPNRKPWAILIILLIIGALFWFIFFRAEKDENAGVDLNKVVASLDGDSNTEDKASAAELKPVEKSVAPEISPKVIPTGDVAIMLDAASKLASDDRLVDARAKYSVALKSTDDPSVRQQIEQKLAGINIKLLLSPRQMPEKQNYVVKSGNSLARIAKRYGTTVDLLQVSNMISNPNHIKPGDRLKVFTGKFSITCSKSRHDIIVYMNGEFFKRYKVGTGKFGKTPAGTFVICEKIKEPPWWKPDGSVVPYGNKKENILGTRWMSLKATGDTEDVRGYGIHGTWSPESVGTASSAGCLRMKNNEVEELFTYIPVGTPVKIVE